MVDGVLVSVLGRSVGVEIGALVLKVDGVWPGVTGWGMIRLEEDKEGGGE